MPNTKSKGSRGRHSIATAAFLFLACCATGDATPARGTKAAPVKLGPEYVGSETCQACHEDIFNNVARSAHSVIETDTHEGWAKHVCESCHGPGAKHAQSVSASDIKNPAKLAAAATDRICLGCHLNDDRHSGRITSSHIKDSVSCVVCHKVHADGPAGLAPRTAQQINSLCSGCHITVMAQFQKPYRHKVPENSMSCVDCHNPHGSISNTGGRQSLGQTFAANEPGCFRCHGDKRGPFTFEHAPVRMQGCPSCHEPHGSVNPRMLVRHEVRLVCLECHANEPGVTKNIAAGVIPPAFHDLRLPRYQNCTVCHQKVHGSYVDRNLTR